MNHERRHKDRPTWISLASDVSSVLYRGGIRIESSESEGHRSASASMGMLLRAHKLHDDYKLSQRNSLGCLRRSFPSSSKKSLRKPFSMERERRRKCTEPPSSAMTFDIMVRMMPILKSLETSWPRLPNHSRVSCMMHRYIQFRAIQPRNDFPQPQF